MTQQRDFWRRCLRLIAGGTALFGLAFVLLPGLTRAGFHTMIYGSPLPPPGFTAEALRYTSLAYAVLGAVMFGWGVLMALLLGAPARRDFQHGWRADSWRMLAISLLCWFVPDTAYSLLSGYWQNAVLNSAFLLLFGLPLLASIRDEG
ncbi:MAG: hypothetical protein CFE37_03890 [Alphaproteobacteria bacterium PA4]|nr:MAG: hypothetical protein CFE37_03890 [Alphaproteobacteria bacterium PA4]